MPEHVFNMLGLVGVKVHLSRGLPWPPISSSSMTLNTSLTSDDPTRDWAKSETRCTLVLLAWYITFLICLQTGYLFFLCLFVCYTSWHDFLVLIIVQFRYIYILVTLVFDRMLIVEIPWAVGEVGALCGPVNFRLTSLLFSCGAWKRFKRRTA